MNAASLWRVSALLLLSVVVLAGILVVTGPLRVAQGNPLRIDFAFTGPIKPGAAIRISGVVVGVVQEIEFLGGQDSSAGPEVMVRLHADLEERAWPALSSNARFFVTTLGVLGEHYLDIMPQAGGTPLAPGSVVRGTDLARADLLLPRAAALLEVMSAVLDEGRADATRLMAALAELLALLQKELSADENGALVAEGRHLLIEIRDLARSVRTALGDGHSAKELLQKAHALADRGETVAGELEKANLRSVMATGQKTLDRLNGTLDGLAQSPLWPAQKQQELILQLQTTLAHIDQLSVRTERLLGQVEQGEGAAGQAFRDETLIQDLKSVLRALRDGPMRPWVRD